MKTRQGFFTESVRDEAFRRVLDEGIKINENCLRVLLQLIAGPKTLQEISKLINMKEHLVSARLNDLRKEEYVISTGEKKINPETNKANSLWRINPGKLIPEQLRIF